MHRTASALVLVSLFLSSTLTFAQDGYFADWFDRVDKTQAEQPRWITPLATVTPRLEEEVRYDQLWQENAKGVTTNNYDGGKGLELIPFEKVEVIFSVPPTSITIIPPTKTASAMFHSWSSTGCFRRTRNTEITS